MLSKKTDCLNHLDKERINFLHQRRIGAIQELRYSAIEIKNYVFRLKCLVPEQLRSMRKSGYASGFKSAAALARIKIYHFGESIRKEASPIVMNLRITQ